ncbi:hypothetical protein [uncultured Clostridium sp.]|uniref:hypothetical protein n=1 Tax=uncultured Clostridium sp. TaxID=59620 RepID=UPI002619EBB4|nr:hypothetical protein [uncultured Clostridium sp.]
MKFNKNVEQSYLNKMKEISEDIWQVLDHIDYYKTIRGIWNQYQSDQELTKRQIVRLFDFIYDLDNNGNPRIYTGKEIHDAYDKILRLNVFENSINRGEIINE